MKKIYVKPETELICERFVDIIQTSDEMVKGDVQGTAEYLDGNGMTGGTVGGSAQYNMFN